MTCLSSRTAYEIGNPPYRFPLQRTKQPSDPPVKGKSRGFLHIGRAHILFKIIYLGTRKVRYHSPGLLRFWKPIFLARAPQTARANINLETLRPLQVPKLPIEQQQRFSKIYQKIVRRIDAQETSNLENDLFNSLVQRAFRGELSARSLSDTDKEVAHVCRTQDEQLALF